ncbi:DNA replication and repair protein RecO [Xenococcus sp. PCC 7305]|uniref:DNA repair protein RecO n=1 Tax=Xenococcus sp. PCC 7305 TaxID=102125 RepID=UPI0002AC4BAE|nr:DNA repair protein RecO [Xenococcus sp. PCC 7305]ELS01091.1 DNA replication and repair protein RecO [Xenococcus sp. PCC 7305]
MPDKLKKYTTTGIILKGSTLKESDRLVKILTPEYGLISATAPGAKKYKSRLRGRTELFVVNKLLMIKGRSLDKIIQAETIYTYPGLSKDLGKLAAAQYLAELALYLAVDEQPQQALYELLNEHLRRIEQLKLQENVYPYLAQAVFHILAIAGIAPQVHACCITQQSLEIEHLNANWRGGLSFERGGVVDLSQKTNQAPETNPQEENNNYESSFMVNYKINAVELGIMQSLSAESLPLISELIPPQLVKLSVDSAWVKIEQILRQYIQHHLGKSIRSADLVDNLYLVEF